MSPPTRRTLLRGVGTLGLSGLAGCVTSRTEGSGSPPTTSRPPSTTDASTSTTDSSDSTPESCSAVDPPAPTTAEASPERYPDEPSQLTTETIESYVRTYERAYQYNRQLAKYPDKLGRQNSLDVSILDTTVESEGERFTAVVSGQRNFGIVRNSETPATPTRTPLPMGHGPFEASYVVTERAVHREGVVVECWGRGARDESTPPSEAVIRYEELPPEAQKEFTAAREQNGLTECDIALLDVEESIVDYRGDCTVGQNGRDESRSTGFGAPVSLPLSDGILHLRGPVRSGRRLGGRM